MNIDKYNYNAITVFKRLLPWFYKLTPETNLLKPVANSLYEVIGGSLTKPKTDIYTAMQNAEYLLQYCGINLVLVKYLNDKYDPDLRRITITENNIGGNTFENWYLQTETDPTPKTWYLYGETDPTPKTWLLQTEINTASYHFTVNVPSIITNTDVEITANIRIYALADKTFNIVRF